MVDKIILFFAMIVLFFHYFGDCTFLYAEDKNGVSPHTISLPSGPGSIEGLGESFQPMLNTGTSRYHLTLPLPAAPAGNTPSLIARYDSGEGYGFAGLGWSYGPKGIRRQLDKGLPLFVDNDNNIDDDHDRIVDEPDEKDIFIGPDGEELVDLGNGNYRARIEGNFARYRKIGSHWEVDLKNGTLLVYGSSPTSQIASADHSRVYEWLLERQTDVNGNTIEYLYSAYPGSDNQKYLKEIRYGPGAPPWSTYYFVSFTYEDRPDWRKDFRRGFLVKTTKRLATVHVGIQGVQPDQCSPGDFNNDTVADALIRRYSFSYNNDATFSHLTKITLYGADNNNYLPPLSFDYTIPSPAAQMSAEAAIITSTNAPETLMDSGLAEFIDMNRDGLPDILITDLYGNAHTCYLNAGEIRVENNKTIFWSNGRLLDSDDSLAFPLHLVEDTISLSDMNGDGISDLVHTPLSNEVFYFANRGDLSWGPQQRMSIQEAPPPAPYSSEKIISGDFDFNKRMDVLQTSSTGYSLWLNYEDGKYSSKLHSDGAVHLNRVMVFDDEGMQLADMNGDQLSDIAQVRATEVIYAASMGYGEFDTTVSIPIPGIALSDGENGQIKRAKLIDINGDGLDDLVVERAATNELWFWLNQGTDSFSQQFTITDMPGQYGPDTEVRWADLNGNGTKDLVYADITAAETLRIFDIGLLVNTTAHQNLLIRVDNGLGQTTTIDYSSSTEHLLEARASGQPWSSTIPFPVSVVSKTTVTANLDSDGDGESADDTYVKEYRYRDGYYEDREKQFRGFAQVTVTEPGDATDPETITIHDFFTGGPDGIDNDNDTEVDEISTQLHREEDALKGKLKGHQVATANGELLNHTLHDWLVKNVEIGLDNSEIRLAYKDRTQKYLYEKTETPAILQIDYMYDDYGNITWQTDSGALAIVGDEVITNTTYINNTNEWLLGLPLRQIVYDGSMVQAAETVYYYDGPDYQGLPLGQATKGLLTRKAGWVADSDYIDLSRLSYDSYGNVASNRDPNGFNRTISWDSVMHAYPVQEAVETGTGSDLTATAGYNLGLGVVTTSRDFNNHQTTYGYDTFARLTSIVRPGDTLTLPSEQFIYTMANPVDELLYQYDAEGALTVINSPASPSSIKTSIPEVSGEAGTLDTIRYMDGMGRALATVREGDQGFVFFDATLFNSKGRGRYSFQPYGAQAADYSTPSLTTYAAESHFDELGRIVTQINPPDKHGVITQKESTFLPLETTITNERGVPRSILADGRGRTIEIQEFNQAETYSTRYEYDPLGNRTRVTDAQNNTKTMSFDGLSRKTSMADPDKGAMTYQYDDAGNLVQTTDNKGQITTYTYDGANRMLSTDYNDTAGLTPDVQYHYDTPSPYYPTAENTTGHLAWVRDLSGGSFFSYDRRGNVVTDIKQIIDGSSVQDFITRHEYDALDRTIATTYPDGDRIAYGYSNRGLLESIDGFVTSVTYTEAGQIDTFAYANGVTSSYTYDPRQRLNSLTTISGAQPADPLQELSYDFDGVSNVTGISDLRANAPAGPAHGTHLFEYDDLERLIRSEGNGYGVIDFQYDKIGNMIFKSSPATPDPDHIADSLINLGIIEHGGSSGASNRGVRLPGSDPGPHAVTATVSGRSYTYDDNGNITGNADGDSYEWDYADRLVKTTVAGQVMEYLYDFSGQRVIKRPAVGSLGGPTYYVNRGYEIRGGKPVKYIFTHSRRVARVEGRLAQAGENSEQMLLLLPGWNFFSVEVESADPNITAVFASLLGNYTDIWTFDAQTQQYIGHVPGEGINDLSEIHAGQGYLIKVTTAATLVLSGTRTTNDISLKQGWNLIGCPGDGPILLREGLTAIEGEYISVWEYNPLSTDWRVLYSQTHPEFLNNLKTMVPGRAYWIEMSSNAVLPFQQTSAARYFFHPDHLGSSSLVTDSSGAVAERSEFYPFGRPRHEESNGFESAYKYTGKEQDQTTGLIYFGARYYEPVIGRFISVDPLYVETGDDKGNPQALGLYTYVLNNPIKLVDPNGLEAGDPFEHDWEAALDFAITYNDDSIRNDTEYGAVIYSYEDDGRTLYSYTVPTAGTEDSVNLSQEQKRIEEAQDKRPVSSVHSHGAWSDRNDNEPSKADIKVAGSYPRASYVVTPSGTLVTYDKPPEGPPVSGPVLRRGVDQIPSDPNSPERSTTVDPTSGRPQITKTLSPIARMVERIAQEAQAKLEQEKFNKTSGAID